MSAKEEQKEKKESLVQVTLQPGQFELPSYIQNYTGHTKVDRLVFIAERCKVLEAEAFRMALEEIKKSNCSLKYQVVTEKIAKRMGDSSVFDQNWIDSVEKRAAQVKEKLEFDLNTAKTQLIRENIRVSF
jgi:COP9 signalosome complex subunit 1